MSAVNEWVVREYFELLGFMVTQPRKYTVPGRPKTADEEVDLVVLNPRAGAFERPAGMVWATEDVRRVSRAVVGVRGWHTERFYASKFEQSPDILRFLEKDSIDFAATLLGSADMAKILCIPRLPADGDLKNRTIAVLRAKGVDGVISFRTILLELIRHVGVHRNYEKSDVLQVIRLLKNYDLLREEQLELFAGRRKPATAGKRKSHAAEPEAPAEPEASAEPPSEG